VVSALLRWIVRSAAVVAFLVLTAVAARAAEPSESCVALDALQWRLAADAQRDERFAVLYGRSFYRTPLQILGFRLELDLRRLARLRCLRDDVPYVPRWHAVLRLSSANAPLQPVDDSGAEILAVRRALHGADLSSVTVAQVQAAIHHAGIDADPAAAAFVFNYLTSPDRAATLARARSELTMPQMVAAAQYYGYLAQLRYDWGKGSTINRQIVPPSGVTDAAAAELEGNHFELTAGNCSDVANAQGDLLEKLGAKDVMVATTAHIIGLHSTVIARDPHSQTYYQLSYGSATRSSEREGADLFQMPELDDAFVDIGIGVYLNRPNGPTLGYVPTNAGKVYAEAAGMDIQEIEPLARATSSLIGAQLALKYGQSVQTFVARDPTGSYYVGAALTQSWAEHTHFPGVAGLVTAWRRTAPGMTVVDFYLQAEQRAISPELRLGSVLRGRVDASLIAIGSYAVPFTDLPNASLGADAALLLNLGTQMTAGTESSRLAGRLRVSAQLSPGLSNIAGASPTVFLNHVVIGADGRARLGRTRVGDLQLIAGSAVLVDSFGPRLAGGVGIESQRFGARLEAWGRVLDSDPTFKEGSLRRGRLLVGVPILPWLRVSTLVEVQEAQTDAKWTLTGGLEGRF
jgi:hypothetical protein